MEKQGERTPQVSKLPSDEKPETRNKKLLSSILDLMFAMLYFSIIREINDTVLPVSSKGSKNPPVSEQKALTWKAFLRNALDIPLHQRVIILTLLFGFLRYLTESFISTTPFEFQFIIAINTPPLHLILTFHEAFYAFSPEIAYITLYVICYLLTWILVLPLQPRLLIFLVPLLIYAPLLVFPHLVRKASASGFFVACGGSFELSLIAFATFGAFGFFLIFVLVVLMVLYLICKFVHGRKPARGQDIEVTDGLLQGMISNA